MKHTITQIVKNNYAKLTHATVGKIHYSIQVEDYLYEFPIDITDRTEIGDSMFNLQEKAIYLTRYIKKADKNNELRIKKLENHEKQNSN